MRAAAFATALLAIGCSSSGLPPTRGDYDPQPFGGARPTQLYVPTTYSDAKPAPLLILLHGYGANGAIEDLYLGLQAGAESHGMLYAHPTGLTDHTLNPYWNATDACCNFDRTSVDDSGYLSGLVAEIGTRYKVDPKRVYFVGHSNGAFMSYRMACEHAGLIAGIMSLAGETYLDTAKCTPGAPVAVLQVQGTADDTIAYGGGTITASGGTYPGAQATVADWAAYNGCSATADTSAPPVDLESTIAGAETTVTKYATGCRANGQVELWSIQGGSHIPKLQPLFVPAMLDWLLAHPKP